MSYKCDSSDSVDGGGSSQFLISLAEFHEPLVYFAKNLMAILEKIANLYSPLNKQTFAGLEAMPPKKKSQRNYCSVMGCKVTSINSPGTHFYSFPSLPHRLLRRQIWITSIRNHNPQQAHWNPHKYSRICSKHFVGNKKTENPRDPSYNPTIFPEVSKEEVFPENSPGSRRYRYKRKENLPNRAEHAPKRRRFTQLEDENFLENDVALPLSSTATKNRSTQVNFEERIFYHNLNSFSCKLYITDTTCEAGVQTSIQRVPRAPKNPKSRQDYVDKGSNTDFRSHDKSCGTETPKFDRSGLLNRLFTYETSSITSDREMLNIAGTTLSVFHMLLKILSRQNLDADKVPIDKSLLIFLMRMKTSLSFSAISSIVAVERTIVSRTFYVTLMYLTAACKKFISWPSRESIQGSISEAFKEFYKHCRIIIDCFEMPVNEPCSDKLSVKFYSDIKERFTIKVLVGYAPNGLVSFVSRCYPGATPESEIVNRCGILNLLNAGDTVIADKLFPEIKESVEDNKHEINVVRVPLRKNSSWAKDESEDIDKIRRVAMDLKKIVRRIRAYKILNNLQVHMYPDFDSILLMCAVLVNCQIIRQL